ncbi:[acyl-carrier-protein] S-malonyltransferase [Aureococcus anophagefferens]|nr:[acyl-carrier-protein] S-malonyltransferase [Aureococcus anophagefferens]
MCLSKLVLSLSMLTCARGLVRTSVRSARNLAVRAGDDGFSDYSAKTTFLFPGQGAQSVGMAAETAAAVPEAAALFAKASDILGYDLLAKCAEGPKEELDSTAVSQPAIFVSSMAAVEKLRSESPETVDSATCAMGLSLGEYSALCLAGAISFEDGVKLTKLRGEAMQAAADATPSSMVSVIGLDKDKVAELCAAASTKSGGSVTTANFLCKGNYAVSGDVAACDAVEEIAKPDFKARMTVRLAVAGAFHTDFMAPAVDALAAALKETDVASPRIPVVSNVDAKPHSDPDVLGGGEKGYELGPGKVISGIFKRIDKTAEVENVVV